MKPRTMTESTLMARSTSAIAAASVGSAPVDDRQDADDAGLDDAEARGRERHGRQQRGDEGHEERAADAERDVEAERSTTNRRRSASVVQISTGEERDDRELRRSTENTPSSKRS